MLAGFKGVCIMARQTIKFGGTTYQVVNGTVTILGVAYRVINIDPSDENLNILGGSYDPTLNYVIVCDNAGDTITGGYGKNIIFGGTGNDVVSGGLGGSAIFGGGGNDTLAGYLLTLAVQFGTESQPLTQSTSINFQSFINTLDGGDGNDLIYGVSQTLADQIIGVDNSVMVAATLNVASNTLTGGAGNDLLVGDFGSEQYVLTNVTLNVTQFFHGNTLIAGSGTDTLIGSWDTLNSTMNGVYGTHPFTAGSNLLIGGAGPDLLIGDGRSFTLSATNSPIQLTTTLGHNTLIAGSGGTTMIGDMQTLQVTTDSVSNGVSFALGGNTLIAGTGNDVMVGSVQSLNVSSNVVITYDPNTFQFALNQHMGADSILDFKSTHDILKFTGVQSLVHHTPTMSDLDSLVKSFTADSGGHGTLVTFKNGGSIDFRDIAYTHQHSILDLVNQQLTHVAII